MARRAASLSPHFWRVRSTWRHVAGRVLDDDRRCDAERVAGGTRETGVSNRLSS